MKEQVHISKTSVSEVIDHLIEKFSTQVRIKNGKKVIGSSNAKEYQILKNSLEAFVAAKYKKRLSSYSFKHIDEIFLTDYVEYLEKRGSDTGTKGAVPNRIKKLLAVFNHAKDAGLTKVDTSVFGCVKEKMIIQEVKLQVITPDIMKKIENMDRNEFSRLEQFHIDLFLFSYYTGGTSISDLAYITIDQIDNEGFLTYDKIRINNAIRIPFLDKALNIMLNYRDKCHGDYILPILLAKHETEKQKRDRAERLSLKINKTLSKVCKTIKCKNKISMNDTQLAFILKMKDLGYDSAYIAKITGCSFNSIHKQFIS